MLECNAGLYAHRRPWGKVVKSRVMELRLHALGQKLFGNRIGPDLEAVTHDAA
jgi:hypothetical protein